MKININDVVKVRLTEYGRKIHRGNHQKFWSMLGKCDVKYFPPEEDENGWSEWQLWDLMNEFGKHVGLGSKLPFETEIEI